MSVGSLDFRMYCSLPKLIMEIGPDKDRFEGPASSKAMWISCGFDWSLLTSINELSPSGRVTA